MKFIYKFIDKESFHSRKSSEFAELVLQSSGQVRRILAKEFGLSISLVDDPIRVVHDGRKVGIGSFSTPKGEVNFSISPKEESIRLKTLFQALGPDAAKSQVRFDRATAIAPTTPREDDFTPAFLLGLLEDISSVSVQFLAAALRKKNVLVRGGVRGRPLIRKYVMDLILGRGFGIYCEVLDDESLREYTVVLVATAVDVVSLLRGWEEMLLAAEHDPKKSLNYIVSRFGVRDATEFRLPLLFRLCRPPFPYGLRDILYKCLQYWRWRGDFGTAEDRTHLLGFWRMSIGLDDVFERYVQKIWRESLGEGFEDKGKQKYTYSIKGFDGSKADRSIEPDCIFLDKTSGTLFVVDAKYRTDVGARDQVFQMVTYLDYTYPDLENVNSKVGVLVYPGDVWRTGVVNDFGKNVYFVQMPVREKVCHPEILAFAAQVIQAVQSVG